MSHSERKGATPINMWHLDKNEKPMEKNEKQFEKTRKQLEKCEKPALCMCRGMCKRNCLRRKQQYRNKKIIKADHNKNGLSSSMLSISMQIQKQMLAQEPQMGDIWRYQVETREDQHVLSKNGYQQAVTTVINPFNIRTISTYHYASLNILSDDLIDVFSDISVLGSISAYSEHYYDKMGDSVTITCTSHPNSIMDIHECLNSVTTSIVDTDYYSKAKLDVYFTNQSTLSPKCESDSVKSGKIRTNCMEWKNVESLLSKKTFKTEEKMCDFFQQERINHKGVFSGKLMMII